MSYAYIRLQFVSRYALFSFFNLMVISTILFRYLVRRKIISESETCIRFALSAYGVPATIGMLLQCFDVLWIVSNHQAYLGSICHAPATAGILSQCCQVFWIHF
jgi:hypothetical protein